MSAKIVYGVDFREDRRARERRLRRLEAEIARQLELMSAPDTAPSEMPPPDNLA